MALPSAKPFQQTISAEMMGAYWFGNKESLGCNQLETQGNQKLRKCKADVVYKNTKE